MMTVRFPNGQAVQYNTATYVLRKDGFSDLYTKKDGTWIAQVPNTCIIESVSACRVYDGMHSNTPQQLDRIEKELRAGGRRRAGGGRAGGRARGAGPTPPGS